MMKVLVGLVFIINMVFANGYLESIYENIILKNTNKAIEQATQLQKVLEKGNQTEAQKEFAFLAEKWKQVQAFYLLGELNSSYIDTPRYIDIYHHGNEDITVQLQRVVASDDGLEIALFKHSFKTINALEYILFSHDTTNQRVKDIALIITQTIHGYLQDIHTGYTQNKQLFMKNEQKANAMMLNALIESSYKLKEWRVGDAAGLSRKYKGDVDSRRAEYFLSKNSQKAIEAIINTHLDILDNRAFKNYGSLIESYGIKKELDQSIKHLKNAQKKLHLIDDDNFTKAKPLFEELHNLHTNYFITLIGELKVTAKVLDADGD